MSQQATAEGINLDELNAVVRVTMKPEVSRDWRVSFGGFTREGNRLVGYWTAAPLDGSGQYYCQRVEMPMYKLKAAHEMREMIEEIFAEIESGKLRLLEMLNEPAIATEGEY